LTSWATTAESLAGLAGARGLDRRVEPRAGGLLGNGGDQLQHVADASSGLRHLADPRIGLLRLPTATAAMRLDSCT